MSDNAHITNICYDSQRKFLFSKLLISGDIESNPGPVSDDEFKKFSERIEKEFGDLKNDLRKATQEINELRNDLQSVKGKVRTLEQMNDEIDIIRENTDKAFGYVDEVASTGRDMVNPLKDRVDYLEMKAEKQEIYSRRENIIIKGIDENTDENVLTTVLNHLNCTDSEDKLEELDFQRVHRLGKPEEGKSRHIIARFVQYQKKQAVIKNKEIIKDKKGIHITNDLTSNQRKTLHKLNERYPHSKCWYRGDQLMFDGVRRDPGELIDRQDTTAEHDAVETRRGFRRFGGERRQGGRGRSSANRGGASSLGGFWRFGERDAGGGSRGGSFRGSSSRNRGGSSRGGSGSSSRGGSSGRGGGGSRGGGGGGRGGSSSGNRGNNSNSSNT